MQNKKYLYYVTHKLQKHYKAYDGSYESMRKVRIYLSLALNIRFDQKRIFDIIKEIYPIIFHGVIGIMEEHDQCIIMRHGECHLGNQVKALPPLFEEDVPQITFGDMIHYRTEFPEYERF